MSRVVGVDIPNLAFKRDGSYDLSTAAKRLAACEAALRSIATVPIAYYGRGPDFCRDEMARRAGELASDLARERSSR